jgi:sugar lactone lactonase YvrE
MFDFQLSNRLGSFRSSVLLTATLISSSIVVRAQMPPLANSTSRSGGNISALARRAASPAAHPAANSTQSVAAPTFSVAAGTYANAQSVVINDATPGATIYFTTNGTYPSIYSTKYTGPISVSSSEIVVAVALETGYANSPFASAEYLISSVPTRFLYAIAGNQAYGYAGDGGPAPAAVLDAPNAAVTDIQGNVYIADTYNNLVRKVDAKTGIISTIAGTGEATDSGDGGPATSATLWNPEWLALDSSGDLFIGDQGQSIVRKLVLSTGIISAYAGNPNGTGINTGPAANLKLSYLTGLSCDAAGDLFIGTATIIFKVDTSGNATELAGADDVANFPSDTSSFAIDSNQNIYVYSPPYRTIYKIDPSRNLTVYAGGPYPQGGDGGPATKAGFGLAGVGLAVDSAGNLYAADNGDYAIREINAQTGIINTIAGAFFEYSTVGGSGDPATSSTFYPSFLSLDTKGNIYVADIENDEVWLVTAPVTPPTTATAAPTLTPSQGTFATPQSLDISGSTIGSAIFFTTDGTTPSTNQQGYHGEFNLTESASVQAVAVAPGYLKSAISSAAYAITQPPRAIISTVAGNGTYGFSGVGGAATAAQLGYVQSVAVDAGGKVYIADYVNNVVWSVTSAGTIGIAAGTGNSGYSGDGGPATSAQLASPYGVAVDNSGNLYIADFGNNVIREVTTSTGTITTIAGSGANSPILGDGGPALSATLSRPQALAFDTSGNLYIADAYNCRVRMITAKTGIITTVAGNLVARSAPADGGPATSANLNPVAIALDSNNNLFIADAYHGSIRKVDASTGIISTIAGGGTLYGDSVPATKAAMNPDGVAVDSKGTVYIADQERVQTIQSDGTLTTVAGTGYYGYSGDGGSATMADITHPVQLSFDQSGNLYIPDQYDLVVRKVSFPTPAATPVISLASGTYAGSQTATITDATPNATIYYTTDGTTPNTGSTKYSGAITISQTETLQAIAAVAGYTESATGSAAYTITLLTPTISIGSSSSTAFSKSSLTFTATVSSSNGTPSGTVEFIDGTNDLGSGTVSAGVASFSISSLADGTHSISAVYSGDSLFASVTSSAVNITVEDFTLGVSSGSSSSASASAGGSATYSLAVAPSGSSTTAADINLSISGLPAGAIATFNPAKVSAGSGTTTVSLQVNVPATTAATNKAVFDGRFAALLSLVLLPLLPLARDRRRFRGSVWLFLLLGTSCLVAVCGCGSGAEGGSGNTNPPPQNYTLTVTATSGALSHTTTLTLLIQ